MAYRSSEKTRDIEVALRKRYPEQSHALIFQVPDGTGGNKRRTADALSFSLWPSRGLDIEGIEIKASRSDWRKEIEDPHKAAAFSKHCHRWWIATLPSVVESGEVPANWGVLELKRGVLRQAVEAPRNASPEDIPFKMWVGIMRAVQNNELAALRASERALTEKIEADVSKGYQDRLKSLTDAVTAFREATGIDVRYSQYQLDDLKRALDHIKAGREHDAMLRSLRALPTQLRRVADQIEGVADA